MVLKNKVTDADGDTVNETFQVYTTNADGTPKAPVDLDGSGSNGVLVSPYVPSGSEAKVTVPYGILKPGVVYTFRGSAYDGSLYETVWSPWANFRIDPYVTFPAPQTSSSIDSVAQVEQEIFRSDPGGNLMAPDSGGKQKCSSADDAGHKLCFSFTPAKSNDAKMRPSVRTAAAGDLVPWCEDKPYDHSYITRTDACLKSLGSGNLIFASTDESDPPLGIATFNFEQRIKAYRNKGESGSDFAEFDQQLFITPTHIDSALLGVNLYWPITTHCSACDVTSVRWTDLNGGTNDGRWEAGEEGAYATQIANVTTKWTGTGKENITLDWNIRGQVDVSDLTVTSDYGSSGPELTVRCDDIVPSSAPGCVLPYFTPTYTVDTNLYPAAGAYYWLMQRKTGGLGYGDEPLHYLGKDTTVTRPDGAPWTKDDSRSIVCPTGNNGWKAHVTDASLGKQTCDEFAMATTHESGGFPGGPYQVPSGDKCAQLFVDKSGSGYGLFADTRTAVNGPSWSETCGRAGVPDTQNTGPFNSLQPTTWRLLDNDAFYLSNPGFEHCTTANTTCAWKKIG
ncbi:hypothetical protein [Streptomyces griseoaurantiacus]|uniref:hypothetical protein n=1 Tax=Streptomyces griseoaurantiacus TaxID=68213 RepID=UPI002E2B0550|nr:hypothetical protein [Streptomyces jietaisiensis]